MAHVGRFYPYGPPRDLGQQDESFGVGAPANRLTIYDLQLAAGTDFIEEAGPLISEPIGWTYTDGSYWWSWSFVSGGHTVELTFTNRIPLQDPNIIFSTWTLTLDGVPFGESNEAEFVWAGTSGGNVNTWWPPDGEEDPTATMLNNFENTWWDLTP